MYKPKHIDRCHKGRSVNLERTTQILLYIKNKMQGSAYFWKKKKKAVDNFVLLDYQILKDQGYL